MSLSPERFIQIKNQQVQTQPIKGTRKRGATDEEDKALISDLSNSEKDKAENLMIVDLMRNDLGKCCKQGSIKVPTLFEIETHPNVHHLVSTVTAELPQTGVSASLELLKSSLPGGSVTGAPKKRAMEIIDELESFSRSIYCGSVAYIDNSGNMDSNILIRSLLLSKEVNEENGIVRCWGGGGIVADSKAELEYEESLQKIRNLLDALS
jgi:para-aminobenzoate synthetase component 1